MSKKPQNKPNPKAQKIQIVDQQTQPFLRTLQKRVRNINKKLTQIAELSVKKDDLKPQQIQKINRKNQFIEQKNRLQQMANYYRQTLIQNAQYYRNLQLKELDVMAASIAVFNTGRFKQQDKLEEIHNLFFGSANLNITLSERIAQISSTLRKLHSDQKLKKSIASFVEENGNKKVEEKAQEAINKEQVNLVASLLPEEPPKKEEPAVIVKVQQQRSPVKVTVNQQPKPVQAVKQQVPAQNKQTKQQQKKEEVQQQKRPRGQHRTRNNNRNRDGNRQYRDRNNYPHGDRKYKPKFQSKGEQEGQQQRQSPSDDDQQIQPEVRNFRRDEIRKLEDEGFTVIGKPKPKAKQGQKEWHDHTHGKKHHHHHFKQNH